MSIDAGTLQAKLSIDSSDIDALKGKASGLAGFLSGVLGTSALGPLTLGLGGLAAATAVAVSTIGGFEDAQARLQNSAMISADQAKAIGVAFLSTAGQATFSAEEMLKAFSPVAGQLSLMYDGALNATQSLDFMNVAMALAGATGSSLTDSTATLTNIMQTFNLALGKASVTADLLYNTSRLTNIPIDTLATTFERLHQKLNEATPTLSDVASLFADFAAAGVAGSRAILTVSAGLTVLLGGTKPVTAELDKLGISVFNAAGQFVGMSVVIPEITKALDKMNPAQKLAAENILFGNASAETWNLVLSDTSTNKLPSVTKAINQTGTAFAAAKVNTDTLGGSFQRLGAFIKDETVLGFQQLMNLKWSDFRDHMGLLSSVIQNLTKGWQDLTSAIFNGADAWVKAVKAISDHSGLGNLAVPQGGNWWDFGIKPPGYTPPASHWVGGPILTDQIAQLHAGEYVGNPAQQGNSGSMAAMQQAMGGGGNHTFNTYVTQTNPTPSDISSAIAWRMAHG